MKNEIEILAAINATSSYAEAQDLAAMARDYTTIPSWEYTCREAKLKIPGAVNAAYRRFQRSVTAVRSAPDPTHRLKRPAPERAGAFGIVKTLSRATLAKKTAYLTPGDTTSRVVFGPFVVRSADGKAWLDYQTRSLGMTIALLSSDDAATVDAAIDAWIASENRKASLRAAMAAY